MQSHIEPAVNYILVRNYQQPIPQLLCRLAHREDARHPGHVLAPDQPADLLVHYAIAIQKQGRVAHAPALLSATSISGSSSYSCVCAGASINSTMNRKGDTK